MKPQPLPQASASLLCLFLLTACVDDSSQTRVDLGTTMAEREFEWNIPAHYPLPLVPADNPVSEAKFQLGRRLFYDKRLSGNQTTACASCHLQPLAFTDGLAHAKGSTGMIHPRSSQALVNVAYNASVNWGNPSTVTLEQQAAVPLFAEFPVELGINDANQDEVLARFQTDAHYVLWFNEVFPNQTNPITFENIIKALATFGRGLNSFNSAYDRYERGETFAISEAAKRGMNLFFDERTECFHCHDGFNFSLSTYDRSQLVADKIFFNNGLYNINGTGAYPEGGQGIFEITGKPEDMGRFRPPTLRNIALTAPYMHDGSLASLEQVVRHYAAGGRNISSGAYAGDGRSNPYKSAFVRQFEITESEIQDLVAFLNTLTDESFITNPRFADPWKP